MKFTAYTKQAVERKYTGSVPLDALLVPLPPPSHPPKKAKLVTE